jgi:post-segregation antitoxin (ccd killing protein)
LPQAKELGIDITGLTNEQVQKKINDTIQKTNDAADLVRNAAQDKEKTLAEAKKYGINTTGLTLDQIKAKIEEAVRNAKTRADLEPQAKELGIDITGLTNEAAQKKINDTIQANIDAESAARNATEDAARMPSN